MFSGKKIDNNRLKSGKLNIPHPTVAGDSLLPIIIWDFLSILPFPETAGKEPVMNADDLGLVKITALRFM